MGEFHIWEVPLGISMKKTCSKCKQNLDNCTDHCPERELTPEEARKLEEKEIDYRDGKWRYYVKVF